MENFLNSLNPTQWAITALTLLLILVFMIAYNAGKRVSRKKFLPSEALLQSTLTLLSRHYAEKAQICLEKNDIQGLQDLSSLYKNSVLDVKSAWDAYNSSTQPFSKLFELDKLKWVIAD